MNIFPPSSKNIPAAVRYVKKIPRRAGVTDYKAVREAGLGPLCIAPMFFTSMATTVDEFTFPSILISLGFGLFGVFCITLGYRTLSLLELFPNKDLPADLDASHQPESNEVSQVNIDNNKGSR